MTPPDRRPPARKGGLLGGHFGSFRKDPLGLFQALKRDCGDVARFRLGPMQGYLIGHPDAIQNVLVTHHRQFQKGYALQRANRLLGEGLLTSEGAFHARQRRLAPVGMSSEPHRHLCGIDGRSCRAPGL
jgi:cytochrome P450